mmetsp:Transcript_12410/g.31401  ORF Transcript_12410/g.31401 Transcript_12410/m.31401 type:complete len:265 (-) Transcript_12410:771-1565(-)
MPPGGSAAARPRSSVACTSCARERGAARARHGRRFHGPERLLVREGRLQRGRLCRRARSVEQVPERLERDDWPGLALALGRAVAVKLGGVRGGQDDPLHHLVRLNGRGVYGQLGEGVRLSGALELVEVSVLVARALASARLGDVRHREPLEVLLDSVVPAEERAPVVRVELHVAAPPLLEVGAEHEELRVLDEGAARLEGLRDDVEERGGVVAVGVSSWRSAQRSWPSARAARRGRRAAAIQKTWTPAQSPGGGASGASRRSGA